MFFKSGAIRRIGESLAKPSTAQKIGDVARGISTIASKANVASGGLLKEAVENIPGGKLALKASSLALRKAQPTAEFLGRAYQRMSARPE